MEEELGPDNNPWGDLTTVTSFDRGMKSCSTRCVDVRPSNNKIVKKVSSSSMVISSLINQLCTLLEKDPSQSKRLYMLLCDTMYKMKLIDPSYKARGFEFIQERYINAICQLIKVARTTIARDSPLSIPRPFVTYVSLYQDQFQETGFIAVGGFGSVFKAVHKLDEVEYAIKKITVKPGKVKTIMNYLEEVKTLAKLNHTNIVAYKQAWIETVSTPCMMPLPSSSRSSSKSRENQSQAQKSFSDKREFSSKRASIVSSSGSSSDIVSFREDSEVISESKQCHSIVEVNSKTSTEKSISSNESFEDHRLCQYSAQANQCTILYIQMALCEKTLRQWLDDRIEPSSIPLVTDIAAQILRGLDYIHSLKIVHHDIKPSNIFISGKMQVQLGDFGLACPLQRDCHDAIVGTCMYAAPEQLRGECDPKSDIYSLGVVLLELLIPMQTSMECIELVKTLADGKIPTSLQISDLEWVNIVRQLIQKDPANRPSTGELLEQLKMDKDLTISRLQDENLRLRRENDVLQRENKQKNELIENQKRVIQELQAAMKKDKR